jgi:hypothetical protein
MAESTVTAEQLAVYLRKTGKNGSKTLSVLGHFQPFVDAFNTEIGKELLTDAINIHEMLLQKIADLTATPEETMEYKAIRRIIMAWSERIVRHEKAMMELTKQ